MENSANTIDAPVIAPAPQPPLAASEKVEQPLVPVAEKIVTAPKQPEKEDKLHWANRMLKVVAYPIAAISGLWVTYTSTHAKFNQDVRPLKEFQAIEKKFTALRQDMVTRCDRGIIDTSTLRAESHKLKLDNRVAISAQLEKLGLDGVVDKWCSLSRNKRQLTIVEGLTVSGIAIGAMLSIANSKALIELFAGKEEQDKGQSL